MSIFRKSKTSRVMSVALSFAMAVFMLGGVVVAPAPAQAQTVAELQAQISALLAQIQALQAQLAAQTGGSGSGTVGTGYVFNKDLKLGDTGEDVRQLQIALNSLPCCQVAASGPGSPGNETSYFGPLTREAVKKFQETYASEILTPLGLTSGTGYFGPSTRAKLNALMAASSGGSSSGGGSTTPTGAATVAPAPNQPSNNVFPSGAARVPFTKFVVTAGANNLTLKKVEVERTGPGTDAAFNNIVLLNDDGTEQYGNSKTFNSNHRALIGDDVVIPAGTSMTFTVAGNAPTSQASQAGQVVALSVVGVQVEGDTVTGTFPITGAAHTVIASLTIGTATVNVSTQTNLATSEEVGTTNYTFAGVRIQAGSAEDLTVRSIRWNQLGSVSPSDLANLRVVVDGVSYPMTVSSDGDYYTAKFGSGVVIPKGLTKEFNVVGDIVGGSNRTSIFDIEKAEDIFVTGNTYGFGITPTAGTTAAETTTGQQMSSSPPPFYDGITLSITAGSVSTVTNDSAAAPAQNITLGDPNAVLGAYRVNILGEPIEVGQTVIYFGGATPLATSGSITNVVIVDENGNVVAGPEDLVGIGGNQGKVTFSDTITYPTGQHTYIIKGNLSVSTGGWSNNDTFNATTTPSSDWTQVEGVNTGDTITLSNSLVTMNTMTVRSGSLTITMSSQPSSQSIVAGASGVELARVILDAGSSGEDVRVSNLPMRFSGTATANAVSNCLLYDGSMAVNQSSPVNGVSGTSQYTYTFDGSGVVVSKGTSKTLSLHCDTLSGTTTTVIWGLNSSDDASVTGVQTGTSISETIVTGNGPTMTLATGGSYTVTADTSILYRVAQAGTNGVTLGAFKFEAGSVEGVMIKQVALELGATASNSPADLVDQKVTLWNGNVKVGEAQFGLSSPDNAISTLSIPVEIPKNESVTITVKGDLAPQNASEGTPGAYLVVNYDGDNNGINGNYAIGSDSGNPINGSSADQTTNGLRIFRSIPTVAVTSSSCVNCLVPGADLYKVEITAGSGRDIGIRALTFNVSATGVGASGWQLFGPNGAVNSSGVSTSTDNGISGDRLRITFDNTAVDRIVQAGTTKTFTLRASTLTNLSDNDQVSIGLLQDTAYPALANLMGQVSDIEGSASTTDRFIWTPFSTTTPPGAGTAAMNNLLDWTNSYGVPGYPSTGQSFSVQTFTN